MMHKKTTGKSQNSFDFQTYNFRTRIKLYALKDEKTRLANGRNELEFENGDNSHLILSGDRFTKYDFYQKF